MRKELEQLRAIVITLAVFVGKPHEYRANGVLCASHPAKQKKGQ